MKILPLFVGAITLFPVVACAEDSEACAKFNALVARTYNFKLPEPQPSPAQIQTRERNLDQFWTTVRTNKTQFLPCLRQKLADANANPFFRFDGINLLMTIEPSLESKRLQVTVYQDTTLPLYVINAERWVSTLTLRGAEGFDVSKAAKRALDDKTVTYTPSNIVPEYADESLSNVQAAFFLWNSQSEERVTPALFALANDAKYAQREQALFLLSLQVTEKSRQLLKKLHRGTFSPEALKLLDDSFKTPPIPPKRANPKVSRAQFLSAFNLLLAGNPTPYFTLFKKVPDAERDAVAVLTPTDVPLLRRVRRHLLVGCNRPSIAAYFRLTGLLALVKSQNA